MLIGLRTVERILSPHSNVQEIALSDSLRLSRIRTPAYPHARQAVMEAVDVTLERGDILTKNNLKIIGFEGERSENPDTRFKASKGWAERTMKALNLVEKTLKGERYFADQEAANLFVDEFSQFIQRMNISLHHIFNADESSIVFRPNIRSTITRRGAPPPPSRGVEKESMTFMPTINATGNPSEIACHLGSVALPLVYVGTAEAPLWQNDTNVNEYYWLGCCRVDEHHSLPGVVRDRLCTRCGVWTHREGIASNIHLIG